MSPASHDDEAAPAWAAHFGTLERYDRFESVVRGYFRQRGVRILISDGVLTAPGGELGEGRLGLSSLSQLCAQAPESRWPRLVAGHFEALERSNAETERLRADLEDYSLVAPRLGVRLYEPGDLGPSLDAMIHRQDIPGLASVLCVDLPSAVRTLKREETGAWGIADDQLFDQAVANLGTLATAAIEEIDLGEHGTLLALQGESFFTASLVLTRDRFPRLDGVHGAFIGVPTRHLALALPFSDLQTLNTCAMLMAATARWEAQGPGSLSRRVWWTQNDRWIEIPYEVGDEGVKVTPPREFLAVLERAAGA
jgi:hypothetical protein